jgi:hypothetical protein
LRNRAEQSPSQRGDRDRLPREREPGEDSPTKRSSGSNPGQSCRMIHAQPPALADVHTPQTAAFQEKTLKQFIKPCREPHRLDPLASLQPPPAGNRDNLVRPMTPDAAPAISLGRGIPNLAGRSSSPSPFPPHEPVPHATCPPSAVTVTAVRPWCNSPSKQFTLNLRASIKQP